MQDVRVTLYDGKDHPVDGKEIAFVTAGKKAFQDAATKAKPIVLEPIVNVELTSPDSAIGDVSGDLSARRGQITGHVSGRGGMITVVGHAPLAELDSLQSRIKSLTGGQGSYTMEFSHYEQVPPNVQHQMAAAHKPEQDEQ
jgi:elongation factor G